MLSHVVAMLLLAISLIAITNLVVGYVLGTMNAFGGLAIPLPGFLRGRSREPELELPIDEPLTAPAPTVAPVVEPAVDAAAAEANTPPPAGPSPTEPPPAQAAVAEAPPAKPAEKPKTTDLMSGLAAFRDKLSAASVELKLNRDDEKKFDSSASKLQDVNHEYLDKVSTTIEQLDELHAGGDQTAHAAKSAVTESAKEVEKVSGEIDSLIEGGLDAEARASLIDKSIEMRDSVAATSSAAEEAVAKADAVAAPPTSEKASDTLDTLFDQLQAALAEVDEGGEVLLAEVRPDKLEAVDDPGAIEAAVLRELVATTDELLHESQTFFAGERCVVLLKGDAFDSAAKRMEHLRQQIGAIEFERAGEKHRATVTCGLVEAHPGEDREALEERLKQALAESERLGVNRTFHHDGAFPTPIPEVPASVTPRTVSV